MEYRTLKLFIALLTGLCCRLDRMYENKTLFDQLKKTSLKIVKKYQKFELLKKRKNALEKNIIGLQANHTTVGGLVKYFFLAVVVCDYDKIKKDKEIRYKRRRLALHSSNGKLRAANKKIKNLETTIEGLVCHLDNLENKRLEKEKLLYVDN